MKAVAVIPARFASTRFPGKLLADATGRPLILHVHDRVLRATSIDRVIVATDDERIAGAVRSAGGEAVMTSAAHPNGTSRVAEAAASLDCEIVVNVQGDEPEIEPEAIDVAVRTLAEHPNTPVATLAAPLGPDVDPADPSVVKVVVDRGGHALYFSRAPIPCHRDGGAGHLRHVGLYAYRLGFLPVYVGLPATPLEEAEKLEQLRILEHGHRIAVGLVASAPPGIDTEAQYRAFVERWTR